MKHQINLPIPVIKILRKLGEDINHARRRRRITIKLMAQRAGISRTTIAKIEKGDGRTSIGGYASVLFALGMIDRLGDLVDSSHDLTGHNIQDELLPKRVRTPSGSRRGGKSE